MAVACRHHYFFPVAFTLQEGRRIYHSSGNHVEENSAGRIRPYRRKTFLKEQKLLQEEIWI
jgi:hypothetical protein